MKKKTLLLSIVAATAVVVSSTAVCLLKNQSSEGVFVAQADEEYKYTFNKDSLSFGSFDDANNVLPFTLSKKTKSGYDFKTVDFDPSTFYGAYIYAGSGLSDIDSTKEDELFSLIINETYVKPYAYFEFRVFEDGLFDDESSYISYEVDGVSKTQEFSYLTTYPDGYSHYYAYVETYGSKDTVFSIKYVYVSYLC